MGMEVSSLTLTGKAAADSQDRGLLLRQEPGQALPAPWLPWLLSPRGQVVGPALRTTYLSHDGEGEWAEGGEGSWQRSPPLLLGSAQGVPPSSLSVTCLGPRSCF